MAAVELPILFYFLAGSVPLVSSQLPVIYPFEMSTGCTPTDFTISENLNKVLTQVQHQLDCRNRSCYDIVRCFPSAPSGNYQIYIPNGSLVKVYCSMEGTNCGNLQGWTRVANVNMRQPNTICPHGFTQRVLSGRVLCGRNTVVGCQSSIFSTHGLSYSHVCGKLLGYQYGGPDAFNRSIMENINTVNGNYVDGASITYGSSPRKHIWTYAVGTRTYTDMKFDCPCNNGNSFEAPSVVGSDYYCESAFTRNLHFPSLYQSDPLWDGQQCSDLEALCCTRPNMPWFIKTLAETTTESIEVRLCGDDHPVDDEDVLLEVIEFYVR